MKKFKIINKIKNLETKDIRENLFHYSYDSRNLRTLLKNNVSKDDLSYISAYSSFKGEVYENILYELLQDYALKNDDIIKFVLKGPYQNKENLYIKSGLLIDNSSQIVYRSAYKDISEFDALFFTKDSIYFVEMSTSKKTASLNKRLAKKYALLRLIFPHLHIKCLIIVTYGSIGLKNFPSFATVWTTKDLEDEKLVEEIIFAKKVKNNLKTLKAPKHKKFVEALDIKYKRFQYFPTLQWILKKSRGHSFFTVDLNFFSSKKLNLYFDVYTKLYIGYMSAEEFKKVYEEFDLNVINDKVIVTIEKVNQTELDLVYYVKVSHN